MAGLSRRRLLRRGAALLPLLSPAVATPAAAANIYVFDQRNGRVEFSVAALGLFNVTGSFARFDGRLDFDLTRPERSSVTVDLHVPSVEMPAPDQAELLRSPAYFDAARFPVGRFASTGIETLSPTQYILRGQVTLRGITQPLALDAVLRDRRRDPVQGVEVADLLLTGKVARSAFGMVADRPMLSDSVNLSIRMHLIIPAGVNVP